jgi:hypothetical protein
MMTAEQDGRRLRLDVEGLDPMWVEPLSSRRGRFLTEEFVQAAVGKRSTGQAEQIFIEALGPANYARISGAYIVQHDEDNGRPTAIFGPEGEVGVSLDGLLEELGLAPGQRYVTREDITGLPVVDGDPIRQEEGEALALCAFYWQTVVGMEAVKAFLDDGGGTGGSLKALALLQTRLGLSPVASSRSRGMESLIQQGVSEATSDTGTSSGSVELPAEPRPRRPLDRLPKGLLKRARDRTS